MNANLLWQLMQSMNEAEANSSEVSGTEEIPSLPPPFNALLMMRHMFPPREQRMIDVMLKFQELKVLIAELQCEL